MQSASPPENTNPAAPSIWLSTLLVSAFLPVLLAVLLQNMLPNATWVNLAFHSFLESTGAFAAIVLAIFIITMLSSHELASRYIWVAASLISMGIYDALHSMVLPGDVFIWLHSLSSFFGGLFFALLALPQTLFNESTCKQLPKYVAFSAIFIGVISILFPQAVPAMSTENAFSITAQLLNIIGGIGFIIAWLFFSFSPSAGDPLERKLLASHTLLFGSAALLFSFSTLWDPTWWLWHVLRLIAYLVILSFFFKIYLSHVQRIKQSELSLSQSAGKLTHEKALLAGIIENSSNLISLKDTAGRYLLCNSNFADFYNETPNSVIGKTIEDLASHNTAQYEMQQDAKVVQQKSHIEEELNYSKHGEEYTFLASRFPILNPQGEVYAEALVLTDITIRKLIEEDLEMAKKIIDHTSEAIMVTDNQHQIKEINQAFTRITGYMDYEIIDNTPIYLDIENHSAETLLSIKQALSEIGSWSGEIWITTKAGKQLPIWISITGIFDGQQEASHYVSIFHDISKTKKIESQLEELAYYDPLTNLPNRRLFKERLQHDIAASHRQNEQLALLLFDLDEFKLINDSMGHDVGDDILQQSAKRIKECIREADTPARLGGDEFTVILLDAHDASVANQVAEKILKALKMPFYVNQRMINIGVSIGISIYPHDGSTVADLVKCADLALYKAKAAGKNTYQYFSKELQDAANENMQLKNEIRDAIKASQFEVYYQAKIDAQTQDTIGMEALVRWNHPIKGMIPPNKFIPHAEQSGSIIEIGEIVLLQACIDAIEWHEKYQCELTLSVNLSSKQFKDKLLLEKIKFALQVSALPPQCLELEITESSIMEDVEDALLTLHQIHQLGIKVSIDDFGTGYSSLAYLKRFPINSIKIDQSFVRDIETDADDRAIIETIILLSEKLNVDVVAEGVETDSQFNYLKKHHCNYIQGFLFHKPSNKAEFENYLNNHLSS